MWLEVTRFYLHFTAHQLFTLPVVPRNSLVLDVGTVKIPAVERHKPAPVEPPAATPFLGAVVLCPTVVVDVRSAAEMYMKISKNYLMSRELKKFLFFQL